MCVCVCVLYKCAYVHPHGSPHNTYINNDINILDTRCNQLPSMALKLRSSEECRSQEKQCMFVMNKLLGFGWWTPTDGGKLSFSIYLRSICTPTYIVLWKRGIVSCNEDKNDWYCPRDLYQTNFLFKDARLSLSSNKPSSSVSIQTLSANCQLV